MVVVVSGWIWVGCPDPGELDIPDDDTTAGDDDSADAEPCGPDGSGGPVTVDGECHSVMPYAQFDPDELIEWQWSSSPVDPEYDQVMMTPIVVSLTDDNGDSLIDDADIPDVVFTTYTGGNYTVDGRTRAISGADGTDLWTISDANYATHPGAGLAAGDLDGDGIVEIVAITDDGEVMLVEHDGTVAWVSALGYAFGNGTHPAIADLLADGDAEIILGRVIVDSTGGFVAEGGFGSADMGWGPMTFAADVNDDGIQEIIADNAVYRADGSALWSNGGPAGFPAIADFDLDGNPETVVVAAGDVYVYDAQTGATVWGPVTVDSAGRGGPPTVADYDGDGYPEVGVAGLGYYTALDTDGSLMWSNLTEDDSSSMTGSSVFDFNGDGVAEVVYADEHTLYVYEGPTGTILFEAIDHASGTLWEMPLVVDIDHDNSGEIVVASNNMWWEGWTGITVLGAIEQSWFPARGIWNQHAYSITNIEDDGSIPADPEPPWGSYNSFRRNTLSDETVLHAPDLQVHSVSVCTELCPAELVLLVEVANAGLTEVTAGLPVGALLFGEGPPELLGTAYLPDALPSGAFSPPLAIHVDPATVAGGEVRVGADYVQNLPEGFHAECDEDNNWETLMGIACP